MRYLLYLCVLILSGFVVALEAMQMGLSPVLRAIIAVTTSFNMYRMIYGRKEPGEEVVRNILFIFIIFACLVMVVHDAIQNGWIPILTVVLSVGISLRLYDFLFRSSAQRGQGH